MNSDYGSGGMGVVGTLIYIVVIVFYIFCLWKIFVKAGKPGWAAIIPIYNILVELEIVGRPWYWLLLMFIPVVDIVLGIIVLFRMSKVFGHGTGFGFGLLFLSFIFLPILAFDESKYLGPNVE
jgi:hypothetical protein